MALDDRALSRRIGERIQERRQELLMTQTQLADVAGVLRTTIANIESGRQRVPLHVLYKLATSLDVEARDLLPPNAEVGEVSAVSVDINGETRRISPKTAEFLRHVHGGDGLHD